MYGEPHMSERFFNRDLSWLEFNKRVLSQAQEGPLLERVRFLSIFSSNLDEFFMKRVGYLKRMTAKEVEAIGPDRISPMEILAAVRKRVISLIEERGRIYGETIVPALQREGIELVSWAELTSGEREVLSKYFRLKV